MNFIKANHQISKTSPGGLCSCYRIQFTASCVCTEEDNEGGGHGSMAVQWSALSAHAEKVFDLVPGRGSVLMGSD